MEITDFVIKINELILEAVTDGLPKQLIIDELNEIVTDMEMEAMPDEDDDDEDDKEEE